ncbi:FkbM family methyltransferase [Baia soyae]|uniref:FkbM family methyltransferase n=1 Tax=Baia soyae TaxID=1544746 RepID=A0A4R2RZ30_9BACL|nr:FkbM family methyltransferase [Baia soyae]TCP70105.1 FkbM family methyltransferase [Baia soyae]
MSTRSVSKRTAQFNVIASPHSELVWNLMGSNGWEEHTFNILDRFLSVDHTYLDIGAWVGPTALYGAHLSKHVYAIEPDQVAFAEFKQNLDLNPLLSSKTTPINAALSGKSETINLYSNGAFGNSMSSIMPTGSDDSYTVEGITISDLMNKYNINDLNFIKMDVEGSEYFLVPAMEEFLESEKPTLYLSFHPPFLIGNLHREYPDVNEANNKFNEINRNLLEILRMYKYIYDVHGNSVSEEIVLNERHHREFVFSNEPW